MCKTREGETSIRMLQTQTLLDELRHKFRREDASCHTRSLQQHFPIASASDKYAGLAAHGGVSRDTLNHLLHQLNPDEYVDVEPRLKKQKTSSGFVFVKRDPVQESIKQDAELLLKMKELMRNGGKERVAGGTAFLKKEKQIHREKEEMEPPKPSRISISEYKRTMTVKYRDEEIAELEEKIRAQHLSSAEDDHIFYDRLAERETSTLLEEVLLEDLYDLAVDVFDEEEEKSRNKELPPELLEIVEDALHEGPMEEVIVQKYNVDITRRHLQVLVGTNWLNDEVINFYFQLMNDRDEELVNAGVLPKRSHFFNSFFYTKVSENGYNFINVRRWTRKIDLFAMDKIFMPVNVGNMHWCMAVIFMAEKRIQYYDSMHGSGAACLKVLLRYLHDESEHKKKQKFDDAGWELVTTTADTPTQNNGSDCGVFSCMFADYLSQNKPLSFSQKDIPFHRHRMVLHVSRGYIPLDEEGL